MRARPRHIAAAGVAGGLLSASLFLGHAALTPKQPVAPAVETKPAHHIDMLSGRSVTSTRFVANGAPAASVPATPRKLSPCGKRKKREG